MVGVLAVWMLGPVVHSLLSGWLLCGWVFLSLSNNDAGVANERLLSC